MAQPRPQGPGSPPQDWHHPWESPLPQPTPCHLQFCSSGGAGRRTSFRMPRSPAARSLTVCPFPPEPCHPPVKLQPGILAPLCPKPSAPQDPDFYPIPGCLAGILVAVPRTHLDPPRPLDLGSLDLPGLEELPFLPGGHPGSPLPRSLPGASPHQSPSFQCAPLGSVLPPVYTSVSPTTRECLGGSPKLGLALNWHLEVL